MIALRIVEIPRKKYIYPVSSEFVWGIATGSIWKYSQWILFNWANSYSVAVSHTEFWSLRTGYAGGDNKQNLIYN